MMPLTHYLAHAPQPQSAVDVILWWESRRLFYNGIIFVAILVSALLVAAGSRPKRFAEYLSGTGTLVVSGLGLLQIPANIWFTVGWIADLFVKKVLRISAAGFGPWTLAGGTVFSLLFIGALAWAFFVGGNSFTPFSDSGSNHFIEPILWLTSNLFLGFQLVLLILAIPIVLIARIVPGRRNVTEQPHLDAEQSELDTGECESK